MAAPSWWGHKVARLPAQGVAIVATDLQGNLDDFHALLRVQQRELDAGRPATLVLCGDLVHGPDPELTELMWPDHLGSYYRDRSAELALEYIEYACSHDTVLLLGNHEHAHAGGPVVSKFHLDEAAVLEAVLGARSPEVRNFFTGLPLVAVAPCGMVCTHGAPRATEVDLAAFERLRYDGLAEVPLWQMIESGTVGALLWARAATATHARALLAATRLGDHPNAFVVYGHDVVREGFERIGDEQICVSTSFGCFDRDKVYLRIELDRHYRDVHDLREGHEILPLYPEAHGVPSARLGHAQ
jgi:Calcineurin-like phosphoesterase